MKQSAKSVAKKSVSGQKYATVGFVLSVALIIPSFGLFGIPSIISLVVSSIGYRRSNRPSTSYKLALAGVIISTVTLIMTYILYWFVISQYLHLCQLLMDGSGAGECFDFFTSGKITP